MFRDVGFSKTDGRVCGTECAPGGGACGLRGTGAHGVRAVAGTGGARSRREDHESGSRDTHNSTSPLPTFSTNVVSGAAPSPVLGGRSRTASDREGDVSAHGSRTGVIQAASVKGAQRSPSTPRAGVPAPTPVILQTLPWKVWAPPRASFRKKEPCGRPVLKEEGEMREDGRPFSCECRQPGLGTRTRGHRDDRTGGD